MAADEDSARVAELEADNRRLRRLLDQGDAPGELRHRLRSTLALLRNIIVRSAETRRELDDYVAHLEDRLDAVGRAQAMADTHGRLDLHAVLADELLQYGGVDGERVSLTGPSVQFEPRAGQVFALALHELAVNAVEHGALGDEAGRLDIDWAVGEEDGAEMLRFAWRERSPGGAGGAGGAGEGAAAGQRSGFGTEVLTRTLAYELKAATAFEFGAEGLRCTIRFPLGARIARVGSEPPD